MGAEAAGAGQAAHEPTRRLFVALWPDETMRRALAHGTRKAVRASGGRPVPAGNLHVTLAFLGSVPERRLPELAAVARQSVGRLFEDGMPLELRWDRLEHWRAAQLLCAVAAEPSTRAAALAASLQGLLAQAGFAPDLKPFRPHVTVARKVARPIRLAKMPPVPWSLRELALVESRTLPEGALYSVVESYPLAGAGTKSPGAILDGA